MALPRNVVREDHRLEEQAEKTSTALAELRWHWTLDESNQKRVSLREYARSVGKAEATIRQYANGYALRSAHPEMSAAEAQERSKMGVEQEVATEAVAKARGIGVPQVSKTRASEVRRVREMARQRAVEKGTNLTDEAGKVADWIVKSEQAIENVTAARRKKTDLRVIAIEAQVLKAIKIINRAIDEARGVDLDEDAIEFLETSRDDLRKAWALLDAVLAGAADVDWDTELANLTGDAS